jgi:hypothetical protein
MRDDPIVDEVRRVRDEHARRFGYDLEAIFRDLKAREKETGKHYSRYPSRSATPSKSGRPA